MTLIPKPENDRKPPELVDIGEDGEWLVGYGHIEPRLFGCLAVAHVAATAGLDSAAQMLDFVRFESDIDHRWAVERVASDPLADDDPAGVLPGDEYITWGGITADTPGAFPVTLLETEL